MNVGGREGEGRMVIYRLLDGLKIQMSKACIDRSDSLIFQHKRRPRVTKYKRKYILGSHTRPLKFISAPLKAKHFISPGHNQIWIYDDVTHICKMAPRPRNTREGHFLALCCA